MGCCMSSPIKEDGEISRPTVIRKALDSGAPPLPLGVLLTGGSKLREAGLTGKGVRVAVIDSGVDKDHPGFNGMVKKQEWYRSETPLSEDDHGTHVAGTIHFMAPDAEIYDYRVFGESGRLSVTSAIAAAIYQAVKDECQVINMSLGGPHPVSEIRDAVRNAHQNGVIVVCAAGNEGDDNPLTNEVSVAAVSRRNDLPVAAFSNSNPQVDYAGIGVDVVSFKPGGGFQQMSGTSMASPHVAGFVACLLNTVAGGETSQTDERLRKVLDPFALDIGIKGPDNAAGLGFLTYLSKPEFDQVLPKIMQQLIPATVA